MVMVLEVIVGLINLNAHAPHTLTHSLTDFALGLVARNSGDCF